MDLIVRGLEKSFAVSGGRPGFRLHLPSLSLRGEKLNFLMGHNGSGKTVLLKLLSGEMSPSRGKVLIAGDGISWRPSERPIGIVRQRAEESLAEDLSILENFAIRSRPSRLSSRLLPAKAEFENVKQYLAGYGQLPAKVFEPVKSLSVGQRQTVAFLVVAQSRAPLLLLDEFLSATDLETSDRLLELARGYAEGKGAAAVIVSHDIELALKEADRIVVLAGGRLRSCLERGDAEWNEQALAELLSSRVR